MANSPRGKCEFDICGVLDEPSCKDNSDCMWIYGECRLSQDCGSIGSVDTCLDQGCQWRDLAPAVGVCYDSSRGVCSSLGKGIAAASIGTILKASGFKVFTQKLDPYLNVDPGTLNPIEHGEVFVCEEVWEFKPTGKGFNNLYGIYRTLFGTKTTVNAILFNYIEFTFYNRPFYLPFGRSFARYLYRIAWAYLLTQTTIITLFLINPDNFSYRLCRSFLVNLYCSYF